MSQLCLWEKKIGADQKRCKKQCATCSIFETGQLQLFDTTPYETS